MRAPARSLSLAIALAVGLSACASGPGPIETTQRAVLAACTGGDQMACQQANHLAPQVYAEQEERKQKDAVASGVVGVLAGAAVIGLAVAAAAAGGGGHHYPYRGRRW